MKDDLKKTEDIIRIWTNGKRLYEFVTKRLPQIRNEKLDPRSPIDKHSDGFSCSESIQSMNIRDLSYSSFTGSYGNSSTYSDLPVDGKMMKDYFLRYLNRHKDEILREMAIDMMDDAENMKRDALQELEVLKNKIENLQHESMD